MFTDGPSPFGPPRPSNGNLLLIVVLVAAVVGSCALFEWLRAAGASPAKSAATSATPAAPRPVTRSSPQIDRGPRPPIVMPRPPLPPTVIERLGPPGTATIYLCKNYGGGSFWSNASCHTQRATIDRMTTVPAGLTFEQQVALASSQAQEAATLYEPLPARGATRIGAPVSASPWETKCAGFDDAIRQNDAAARRPQSGQSQDELRLERMRLQGRRVDAGCR